MADDEACQTMIRDIIKKYGHLDILVNNAGITRDNLVMKMNDEEFDAVYETNLKGVFHTIHHTSRYFLKQKSGRIINISSVSGITGNAGQANYCAAKAGVIGLTKSVARELSSRGITANVCLLYTSDNTLGRRDRILKNMYEDGKISRREYKDARQETIVLSTAEPTKRYDAVETYACYCATRALMEQQGFEFRTDFSSEEDRKTYEDAYQEQYKT